MKILKMLPLVIITTFTVVFTLTWCIDLVQFGVVDSKDVIELFNKNKNNISIDDEFLKIGDVYVYEKIVPYYSLFKYNVIHVGGIYRFTDASNKIDSIYEINKKTNRQKLGLEK